MPQKESFFSLQYKIRKHTDETTKIHSFSTPSSHKTFQIKIFDLYWFVYKTFERSNIRKSFEHSRSCCSAQKRGKFAKRCGPLLLRAHIRRGDVRKGAQCGVVLSKGWFVVDVIMVLDLGALRIVR